MLIRITAFSYVLAKGSPDARRLEPNCPAVRQVTDYLGPFRGVFSVADVAFELRRRHVIRSSVSYVARAYPLVAAAFSFHASCGTPCCDMSTTQKASSDSLFRGWLQITPNRCSTTVMCDCHVRRP